MTIKFMHAEEVECIDNRVANGKYTIGNRYIIDGPVFIGDVETIKKYPDIGPNYCLIQDDNNHQILFHKEALKEYFKSLSALTSALS
jgi:hypothetical protein